MYQRMKSTRALLDVLLFIVVMAFASASWVGPSGAPLRADSADAAMAVGPDGVTSALPAGDLLRGIGTERLSPLRASGLKYDEGPQALAVDFAALPGTRGKATSVPASGTALREQRQDWPFQTGPPAAA
jgi:hypothetical protein